MKKYFVIANLLLLASLQADYVMKYQMGAETQTFMYQSDSHSKMINGNNTHRSEIYNIGEKNYIVSFEDGRKKIIDTAEMRAITESLGIDTSAYAKEQVKEIKYKINKTSKKVKVAGIKGEVWIISGERNGKKFNEEIVVTKDKKVVEVVRSMFQTFTSMSGIEIEKNYLEIQNGYIAIKANGMELKSFDEKKIAGSEYELPKDAQKQKMPKLNDILSVKKNENSANNEKAANNVMDDIDLNLEDAANLLKILF